MASEPTPPYSSPTTPEMRGIAKPFVTNSTPPDQNDSFHGGLGEIRPHILNSVTQDAVNADSRLKRMQLDMLVLTQFSDNVTLHWRPSWFPQEPFSAKFWTLHNPPNVVTERLPSSFLTSHVHTRRMRRASDPPPQFIKTWDAWHRYRELYGIPEDFLSEDMVGLMRTGLPRSGDGHLKEPSVFPLYPEPQPLDRGRYLLDPKTFSKLPKKFEAIDVDQVVVVHSTGELEVTNWESFYFHPSQWTQFDGYGGYMDDEKYDADVDSISYQGAGRRWSYIPWTEEQERSCRPFSLKVRFWNSPVAKQLPCELRQLYRVG